MKKYKTSDPFELAEYLKIVIMYEDLGMRTRGFYQACPKVKIIHIHNNLDYLNRKIVCSHELGHAILHSKLNIVFLQKHTFCVKDKFEREANIFAAELLIPNEILKEYPEYSLEQIAVLHNIPVEFFYLKYASSIRP
ncbi:ImmA/IrrE family metallo-endopeptidase [Clostridium bowmanii]|nr:ImmA/IrrE family metallo-endopeptidase [Clostridium bowmanii]